MKSLDLQFVGGMYWTYCLGTNKNGRNCWIGSRFYNKKQSRIFVLWCMKGQIHLSLLRFNLRNIEGQLLHTSASYARLCYFYKLKIRIYYMSSYQNWLKFIVYFSNPFLKSFLMTSWQLLFPSQNCKFLLCVVTSLSSGVTIQWLGIQTVTGWSGIHLSAIVYVLGDFAQVT